MTDTNGDRFEQLAAQLTAALDEIRSMQAGRAALAPASILPNGFPGPVAGGEIIESAWGNATSASFTSLNNHLPAMVRRRWRGWNLGRRVAHPGFTFPAQPYAGYLMAWSHVRCDFNGGTSYVVQMTIGGVFVAQFGFNVADLAAGSVRMVRLSGIAGIPANTPVGVNVNGSGVANITTYNDPTVNRLDMIYVANHI